MNFFRQNCYTIEIFASATSFCHPSRFVQQSSLNKFSLRMNSKSHVKKKFAFRVTFSGLPTLNLPPRSLLRQMKRVRQHHSVSVVYRD